MRAVLLFIVLLATTTCLAQDSCGCNSTNTAELFRKTLISVSNAAPVIKKHSARLKLNLTNAWGVYKDFGGSLVDLLALLFIDESIKRVEVAHRINFFRTIKDVRYTKKDLTLSSVVALLNHSYINERYYYDETQNILYAQGNRYSDLQHIKDMLQLLKCMIRKKYDVQVSGVENPPVVL